MKFLNDSLVTRNIKAETLIAQCENINNLMVQLESMFSRNYDEDLLKIDSDLEGTVACISRNGIYNLLPQGLFFKEEHLKEEAKRGNDFKSAHDKLKKQQKDILRFFQPFDTEFFRLTLELEKKLNEITEKGNTFFVPPIGNPTRNENIEKFKPLIPFAANIKGNHPLLCHLLKTLPGIENVEIKKIKPMHFRFFIHIENLSREEYLYKDEKFAVFFNFFCHWFLPFEIKYDFRIKDYKNSFTLGESLILDYNTHI